MSGSRRRRRSAGAVSSTLRMTYQMQVVLAVFLKDPTVELDGLEIATRTGLLPGEGLGSIEPTGVAQPGLPCSPSERAKCDQWQAACSELLDHVVNALRDSNHHGDQTVLNFIWNDIMSRERADQPSVGLGVKATGCTTRCS
jgi:hypothetical protein